MPPATPSSALGPAVLGTRGSDLGDGEFHRLVVYHLALGTQSLCELVEHSDSPEPETSADRFFDHALLGYTVCRHDLEQ